MTPPPPGAAPFLTIPEPKAQAVLFLAHDRRPGAMAALADLNRSCGATRDVIALFDQTGGAFDAPAAPPASIAFTEAELAAALPYPAKHAQHRGTLWPNNIDLPVLGFFAANPTYRFVWLVEYDVRFSGDWDWFFRQFDDSGADLLATGMYDHGFRPGWAHWSSLQAPSDIPMEERTRATLSIYRLSAAALSRLDAAYRQGWSGHYEVTTPTILKLAGLRLEDIGGDGAYVAPGNVNRFYRNSPGKAGLAPGTFVLHEKDRPPADIPNMLWNPFKD